MTISSLFQRASGWLPSAAQTYYQWFNFWLLFLSQMFVEIGSFQYYDNPIKQFPRFMCVQLLLIFGWHYFFVICSRLFAKFWKPLGSAMNIAETTIIMFVFILEGYLLITYHSNFSDSLCAVMLATNIRESSEFLHSITGSQILSISGIAALLIASSTIMGKLCTRCYPKLWLRWVFNISLVGMLGLTIIKAQRCYQLNSPTPASITCGIDRLIWSPQVALRVNAQIGNSVERLLSPKHLEGTEIRQAFRSPIDLVLILGETARADYHSAYGFKEQTTPQIDSLISIGDAFCFNDARSGANNTVLSGKYLFTFWNGERNIEWCDTPSLLSVFARGGYATRWFTNQETEGTFSIERMFGKTAQQLRTPQGTTNGVVGTIGYDENILPILRTYSDLSLLQKKNSPAGQLSVIHLMGSHYQYIARYPKTFNRFAAKNVPHKHGGAADERIAEYMNSILYTDYVLGKIYARYRERPAMIIYLSDHGESLYDNPEQPELCGHGGRPCREQADVPFVVMLTPSFRKAYPKLSKEIYDARFRPISTAWLTNTLTLTAGIRTRFSDERYNFFGKQFAPPQKRKTEGEGGVFSFPTIEEKRVK